MDHKIVGNSVRSKMMLKLAEHVAPSDTVVLIDGENGTGKGLLASYIHDLSSRAERPMVSVNCAAMPAVLVESELFGRERGVHTGTLFRQPGCLELANGSTVLSGKELSGGRIANGVLSINDTDGKQVARLKRIERKSSTLAAPSPDGAVVLFDGTNVDHFSKGKLT